MKSTLYLFLEGELKRKDNTLEFFAKEGGRNKIPIEQVREIYFLNEVSVNTKILDFLRKYGIVAHFFNYYGGYSGTFYPKDKYLSGKILVKQVEALSKREIVAKNIILVLGENIYEVLYHYKRHKDDEKLEEILLWIKKDFKKILEKSNSIEQIMWAEGMLWEKFYSSFSAFLPKDFLLNKRVRRPPDNPMNAMISFGNTILYTKVINVIYNTHLDQRISFLHSPAERRFSLSLDLSEVFKPLIVFRTIFYLVNNQKIKVEKHFAKEVNYCSLNEAGRKIFIEDMDARINDIPKVLKTNKNGSYLSLIKWDCYKLIKFILEGKDFYPFSLKRGK